MRITSGIPIGWGFGSSTAECVAAVRAVVDFFGFQVSADEVARLVVDAEVASDSLMFNNRAVLFAQRDALILEEFSVALPRTTVIGFNADILGVGLDTLALPTIRYSASEISEFDFLRKKLRLAMETRSPRLLAEIASSSARIHQGYSPKPFFPELEIIVERTRALGLQVAHSGTIVGVLFDSADPHTTERIALAEKLLLELGVGRTWSFEISHPAGN